MPKLPDMVTVRSILVCGLLSFSSLANAALSIKSLKLSVLSDQGSVLRADTITPPQTAELVVAGQTDTLKLSFTVINDEDGEGIKPHQAFLRFYDEGANEEGIHPVKIASNGKGKFELNVRRPLNSIPATTKAPLAVSLILGSFAHNSVHLPLFDLQLPPSLPVEAHPEEVHYHPKRAIYHTFRADPRQPPQVISATFVGVALSPWALLITLLSKLPIHVKPTAATVPFIGLLAAFEGLIVWYWVGLRIGQVLTYGAVLAVLTAAAGKRALSTLGTA